MPTPWSTIRPLHRDLDQSDVEADARDMLDAQLADDYERLTSFTDAEILEHRYWVSIDARRGSPYERFEIAMCNEILFNRHVNDEFEQPWDDGSWLADSLNREAEEQSLGRPLFPNEY